MHYNNYGAAYVAELIVKELKKAGISCYQEVYTFEEVVAVSEKLQKAMERLGIQESDSSVGNTESIASEQSVLDLETSSVFVEEIRTI